MSSTAIQQLRETLALIGGVCTALGKPFVSALELQGTRLVNAYRAELQRTALALALGIAVALFACAAVAMTMFSLILSLWNEHRVLGVALSAAVFALFALLAILWLHATTRPAAPRAPRP
jgi:uncharacterized membrane protein YqjE